MHWRHGARKHPKRASYNEHEGGILLGYPLSLEAMIMPETITEQALQAVSLDDRYALDKGQVYMSGIHALVRT